MTSNDDLVAVLLRNADLLLAYNSQTAILPNSKLEEALEAARATSPLDYHSDECATLRKEIFRLTNAMKPATLSELHDFPPYTAEEAQNDAVDKSRRRHEVFRYSLAIFALLLFIVCGKYTVWSKKATILMDDIQTAQSQLATERFNEVLHRWETLLVLELANGSATYTPPDVNPSEDFQLYYKHVQQFRAIESRRIEIDHAFVPFKTWWIKWTDRRAARREAAKATADAIAQDTSNGGAPQAIDGGGYGFQTDPCLREFKGRLESIFQEASGHPIIKADGSIGGAKASPAVLEESHVKAWVSVQMREANRVAFTCFFGFPPGLVASVETTQSTYLGTLRLVRDRLDVLNSWILPGIYGALGAVLLTLRVYVNPVQPNPRRFRTIMRIALGGFVGIVVGWFWSPQSNQLFEFANISVGLFTMAFLFGYGIDVFMNLLDRLVGGFSSAIENAGSKS